MSRSKYLCLPKSETLVFCMDLVGTENLKMNVHCDGENNHSLVITESKIRKREQFSYYHTAEMTLQLHMF